ncbi:MAG: HD domain-containing protein [Bacteroidales bacterium]|nr:HD domain-containing protein [Bacteroidales bacterium]
MKKNKTNKLKIFNDPIYGFINISDESIFDIIEHRYFQRLRRINQLGLTYLVYPGAMHTRFQHSMGAMHLMKSALQSLLEKGIQISPEENIAAQQAILLHDIGHGPFSHTLENNLLKQTSHEMLGKLFMERMNKEMNGALEMAISIIENKYPKKFLHQLVSSQLDMDRLDYLKRDSYFTGVSEGVIGTNRLINMLTVCEDRIVVEAKGIYSVEKFLVARRIMYWQVYLHKTVLSAEQQLIEIIKRARLLAQTDKNISLSKNLNLFLHHDYTYSDFSKHDLLEKFASIDDHDIIFALKQWQNHKDRTLSLMCENLLNRHLPKVIIQKESFKERLIQKLKEKTAILYQIPIKEADHFVYTGIASNRAYNQKTDKIFILEKDGKLTDIATASDNFNIQSLSAPVNKYFLCYPKEIDLQ